MITLKALGQVVDGENGRLWKDKTGSDYAIMPDVHLADGPEAETERNGREAQHSAIRPEVANLFRGQALEQYYRGSTNEGHLLEIEPRWMRGATGVILALFGAALLLGFLLHVDREAVGCGVTREGRLVAVVPARFGPELRTGLPVRFALSTRPLAVGSVSATILAPSEVRRLLGPDGAALWSGPEAAVRIEAALPVGSEEYGDGVAGRVGVVLGRERVLFALIPALRRLHV